MPLAREQAFVLETVQHGIQGAGGPFDPAAGQQLYALDKKKSVTAEVRPLVNKFGTSGLQA
jgi:hypothetical protein